MMNAKISTKEKLGFSVGEYSASIVWQTLMFFLPVFYTDTFGLSAAAVGFMFLAIRLFDAVNDPLMGTIADNTSTRWGKFRPYLLWFAAPYGIAAVLMFSVPDFSPTGKLVYAYATYALMMVIYTAIMIPYNAMVGVISPDPGERTSIASYKFVFAYAAGMSVQAFVIPLVARLGGGDDVLGYRLTMGIFGIICIICFLISFASSRERVQPPPQQSRDVRQDLKNLLQNRAWVVLFAVSLATLIYVAIRSAAIVYYFQYYVGDKAAAGPFMVIGTLCVLLGVLPTKWLSEKMGKKKLYIICMAVIAISSALFLQAGQNLVLLYACQIVFSLASGPTMPLLWSMLADAADYGEWKFGRRSTGLVYSAATLGQKAGFSIGGAITMWVLAWSGYVANAAQSAEAIWGIRLTMSLIPALIALLGMAALFFYRLDQEEMETMGRELALQREAVS
jgi:GPH family glycoside/pentoside/hexuronide:cation symporter